MNGKAEGRWLGTSLCDNERTVVLRTNALRAYEGKSSELIPPGPRSRVGTWCCSSSCAGWQDLVLVERDSIQCSISLHLNTIYFYVCTHVPLGSTVACTATICLDYILGNYGHARSQGGRQPAAAKAPLVHMIKKMLVLSARAHSSTSRMGYDVAEDRADLHRYP